MSRTVRFAVALALASTVSGTAAAAGAVEEGIEEVIVTARSLEVTTPLELSRYGYDVEFLSRQKIQDAGFVDTAQALEMLVPGAWVATQMGAFSYINLSLQGSRTADVLWTVDGVRINNRLYNGTSPADTLPSSMIERMEVLKAGQGLLYGTQAAAGVVNVVTKAFSDELGGEVSVGGDSNSGLHANGYVRGALGRNKFVAWASKDETDGFMLYDALQPEATTRERQYDVQNFGLKYGFEFTDSVRLTLQAVHTDAALDYPNPAYTDVNDRNEDIVSGRLDISPSDNLDIYLKAYYHDWDTDYYPAGEPQESAFWGFRDVGFTAAARLGVAQGLDAFVGYDFQSYEGLDEVLLIEEQKEKVNGVYAQLRSTDELSEKARFTAGIRYNDTGGNDATVWSLSGVYEFSPSLYLEASAGTSFLLPDIYELYAIDPFDTRGNPDLEPEESMNYNLSVGGALGQSMPLSWRVSTWYRSIDNLITDTDENVPPGFDTVFINSEEELKAKGAELLLTGLIGAGWQFDASYVYSSERFAGSDQQIADRPLHSGKLGLGYAPQDGRFGVNVALKYAGDMQANVTGFGQQQYGDFVVVNLGAHVFIDSARHHRLGLRVENLFDTDYATRVRSAVLAGSVPATRFMYRNVGSPITGFLNYSYTF